MKEKSIDKKYLDFIEELVEQVSPLLPEDVNELQKSYLIANIRKSSTLMASSFDENEEFANLTFENQCFFIQVIAEWSFHKEIDLFRSGIPPKYWKGVMQKIWFAMWEVMLACVKNDAPQSVVLSLVERFVNRTYNDAIEELKESSIINETIEEKAKEQSNIDKMAKEYKVEKDNGEKVERIKYLISRFLLSCICSVVVSIIIIKFKIFGIIVVLSLLMSYIISPLKDKNSNK